MVLLLFFVLWQSVPQQSPLVPLLFYHCYLYFLILSFYSVILCSPLFSQSLRNAPNTLLSLLGSGILQGDVPVCVSSTWLRLAFFPTCPMALSGRCGWLSENLFCTSEKSLKKFINKVEGKTRAWSFKRKCWTSSELGKWALKCCN